MEFFENVQGAIYQFSLIKPGSFLVSGQQGDYILYKASEWKCADELPEDLLYDLATVIEQRLSCIHA